MLTKEIIKSNPSLATLDDAQVAAIAELSKNDENTVIAAKTREIWDSVDDDIKVITGQEKPGTVKSYDHLKSVLAEYKDKADNSNSDELQSQINTLKTEKANLEKAIKDGNTDGALKAKVVQLEQQIGDKESTITKLRNDITTQEKDYQAKVAAEANKNVDLRFETAFAKALSQVKFKDGIPEVAINATINAAKATSKTIGKPEFQTDDKGNDIIVFRDDKGILITDEKNLQRPLTASDIFTRNLGEIVDAGKTQKGAGTGSGGGNESGVAIDLSSARTKTQADEIIRAQLQESGLKRGTTEFQDAYNEAYAENNVGELPSR